MIKYSITPMIAPNIFDGIPRTMVAFNMASNKVVASKMSLNAIISIEKTIKNAIISYNAMFNTVTPFKMPPNLKNGRCSYKNMDTGFFSKNESITTSIKPTHETSCFSAPLLKPKAAPDKINMMMIISIQFNLIIPFY